MKNKIVTTILTIFFFIILLIGGLGSFFSIELAGLIFSLILVFTIYKQNGSIKLPAGTIFLIFFIILQIISLFWSVNKFNSIEYIILFTGSLGFLIFFYNSSEVYENNLKKLIPSLGILYLILYLSTEIFKISFLTKILPINCCTLYTPYTAVHNHLGDFWAIVILLISFNYLKTKQKYHLLLLPLGIAILIISKSRSAIIALCTSLYLILQNKQISENTKKYLTISLISLSVIFSVISFGKVTILSRPYFLQSIISFKDKPFGVGMGNFKQISSSSALNNFFLKNVATKAHNIFFESISGIGILSLTFLIWFYKVSKKIFKSLKTKESLFSLMFIVLSVIFFFDMCYAIPTMLWLWFSFLGISLSNSNIKLQNN